MSGEATPAVADRRSVRHAATKAEIIDAAWQLARDEGLAGITMRDLGARVGMRAQSLYSYVRSKHDLYDAMFEQGYRQFQEWMAMPDGPPDAHERGHRFVAFCVADPVRFQLLFQRTIPGFTPSAESYAIAMDVLDDARRHLASVGVEQQAGVDLWTAVMTGLASQQIANEPGGTRWVDLVDDAVDMLLEHTRHNDSINARS